MTKEAKERNRQLVDRYWAELWNQGKLDVADQLVSADLLLSLPGHELCGSSGLKEWVMTIRGGFPDIYFTIEQTLVDGDDVAMRWTATGTHTGPLLGIAPTGKKIVMNGITAFRIVDEKIAREHASEDNSRPQPLVLMPGEGRTLTARNSTLTVKVFGKDTGFAWSLSRLDVPADFVRMAPPPHYHTREEESFYILEGTITFRIGDREVRAPAGSFVKSPRNVIHEFFNPDPVPASMLVIGSPAGIKDYLVEIYELLSQPGPVNTATMKEIFEKYGIFITAPSPVMTT